MDNRSYIDKAKLSLLEFFEENNSNVYHSRQLEVYFEGQYYHWITNNALRELRQENKIKSERHRSSSCGFELVIYWNKSYRYYKRSIKALINLVESYSTNKMARYLGWQGEMLVGDAFASMGFVRVGRESNEYNGIKWTETNHNMDFIFQKDGLTYGVEVKNTLPYIDKDEFNIKIQLCKHLGIIPVFAVRMMPTAWTKELIQEGGFALILKYQLYHPIQQDIVDNIKDHINLPVDTPRVLMEGTLQRFLSWHNKKVSRCESA